MKKELVSFDQKKIFYRSEKKSKNKETVVLLHGLTGSGSAFYPVIKLFINHGINVIIPDLRSHGLSEGGDKIQLNDFIKDLQLIIKEEKVRKFHLVGHCFGALVSLEFAKLNPKLINSLILISPPFGSDNFRMNFLKHINKIGNLKLKKLSQREKNQLDYQKLNRFRDWDTKRMLLDWKNTSLKTLFTLLEITRNFKVRSLNFSFPVLIIHGTKDSVAPFKNAEQLNTKITGSKLVKLNNYHHVDLVLDPKKREFLKLILDFLKEVK